MNKYLAYDAINGEYESFETIDQAREWLTEGFFCENEYHPDMIHCAIYTLTEKVEFDVIAKKTDFTEEEWSEKYSIEHDEIWRHKFTGVVE